MATFRMGQRVRVNCPGSGRHGSETTITACGVQGWSLDGYYVGFEVDLINRKAADGRRCIFEAHELEPILPQHEPCEEWFRTCDLDEVLEREGVRA